MIFNNELPGELPRMYSMVQNLSLSKWVEKAARHNFFIVNKANGLYFHCCSYKKGNGVLGFRSVEGFKINLIRSEEHFQSYCNKIFAGWDFCITNRSMADLKHSSLRYELRVSAPGLSLGGFLASKVVPWKAGWGGGIAACRGARGLGAGGHQCLASFPCRFQELSM